MENIEEVFKEKKFDRETLSLLNNFIEEFDDLFGKYVSRDELIKRIKNNLNHNVIFTKFDDISFLGTYESDTCKISLLDTLSEEHKKSIFFHEMIHCITTFEGKTGFYKKEYFDDFEDYDSEILEDSEGYETEEHSEIQIKETPVFGLTEGFTQLASKIRSQKYGGAVNSYPILTEQTENLAEFLGKDQFFNVAFNKPDILDELMIDEGLFYDINDYSDFARSFNILWKNEKQLYTERLISQTPEGRLLQGIFGRAFSNSDIAVKQASIEIISTYLTKYAERDDFKKMFDIIERCEKQLTLGPEYQTYTVVFNRIREMLKEGKTEEEVLSLIPEENKDLVEDELRFRKFLELSPQEALDKVLDPNENVYENIILGYFEEEYRTRIVRQILGHSLPESFESSISFHIFDKLGKYIKAKGLNPETISFEEIEFPGTIGKVFSMYKANGEKTDYLGTFSTVFEDGEFEELKVVEDDEEIEVFRKGLSKLGEKNTENMVLFSTEEGVKLCYLGDENYICVDTDNQLYKNSNVSYYRSTAEVITERLRSVAARYINLSKLRAPQVIMIENAKMLNDLESKVRGYRGEKKFTPRDIERATTEVSLEDVEQMLEEFAEVQNAREESFEKGIGYDGE